jgi:hypothetical protein
MVEPPHVFDKSITKNNLVCQWYSSDSNNPKVTEAEELVVKWGKENTGIIKETDDTFTLDGYVLTKSSKTLTWKKPGEKDLVWYKTVTSSFR